MNMNIEISPEVKKGLLARAHERGVSLDDYLQEIMAREAGLPAGAAPSSADAAFRAKADNLSDLLLSSPFAGANLNLERSQDYPRPVEFE
jgi:hypothetical protein